MNEEGGKSQQRSQEGALPYLQQAESAQAAGDRQVAAAQRLKDAFEEDSIGKEEYVQQLDAL